MANIDTLIRAVQEAATPVDLVAAVVALADLRSSDAVPALIAALGYNNPAAAIAAMRGLIGIGRPAVESLMTLMDDYNYGARAYTVRALAQIGDPRALPVLLEAARNDFAPSVRRAAIKGLGGVRWEWFDLGEAAEIASKQSVLATLQWLLGDLDWSIRYAAIAALDALGMPEAMQTLEATLDRERDAGVRFRARMALGKLLVTA